MSKINVIAINRILGLPLDGAVLHDVIEYRYDAPTALEESLNSAEFQGGFFIRPVSLETIATDAPGIVKEGRALARLHANVVVKVPVIREGLKAVKELSADGIKTNVTLNFSPLQALLAAKCGATYISPFVGRLDAIGHIGMDVVRQIRTIYDNYGFKTQILTAAVRHPEHVLQSALIGADACTMFFEFLKALYDHPLTDSGLDIFLKDWAKAASQNK